MADVRHDPFAEQGIGDERCQQLVSSALAGERAALDELIARHRPWIYNIAFRMVLSPQDAEDVTQEVLIKIVTKLATYDPEKGRLRSWLYRIVANHVISMKRKRGAELGVTDLESYVGALAATPDRELPDSPEAQLVAEELSASCVQGVLLCLDRRQRLVFILATAFDVSDTVGAEILGISRGNFRQILSRGRLQLRSFVDGHCGQLNPEAPCRCRKKAAAFLERGWHTERMYAPHGRPTLGEVLGERMERFGRDIHAEFRQRFHAQAFYESPTSTAWLKELTGRKDFREIFELDA